MPAARKALPADGGGAGAGAAGAPGNCDAYATEQDCTNAGCTWETPCTGTTGTVDCSAYVVPQPCNLDQNCIWDPEADGGNGACVDNTQTATCVDIFTMDACQGTLG